MIENGNHTAFASVFFEIYICGSLCIVKFLSAAQRSTNDSADTQSADYTAFGQCDQIDAATKGERKKKYLRS